MADYYMEGRQTETKQLLIPGSELAKPECETLQSPASRHVTYLSHCQE